MLKVKCFIVVFGFGLLTACQTMHSQPVIADKVMPNSSLKPYCATDHQTFCQENWWHVFHDDVLNDYMQDLVNNNHDLLIATLTLQKSILHQQKTKDNKKIALNHKADINQQQQTSLKTGKTSHNTQFNVDLNASWELDLWGKLQLQQNISTWEKNALESDRQAVFLTLTANALREYFNLIAINKKLTDNQQALQFQQQQHQYLQKQLQFGFIAQADLLPTEQTIYNLKQTAINLVNQKNDSLNTLAILSHSRVDKLAQAFTDQQNLPQLQNDFEQLPINSIQNRPDIQALLWRLSVSLEQATILKKNQYPTLVLTTGISSHTANLIDLLKVPVLNWGIALNLPNFNAKDYQHQVQLAKIDEKIAASNYREAVHKALVDVQNKLTHWENQQQNHAIMLKSAQLAKKQLDYQQKRFELGFISAKALEESRETYRQSQVALIDSLANQAQTVVGIYQAIGGRIDKQQNAMLHDKNTNQ
ncbi:RND efflux system outer membrane lipoprotein [Moraxella macacae 0408225]|uniref:RND efflux system outer membrane lipoprotein n=1 Tax=Moraxella macacae 0408225 TaxID=1230338 RepID=L2F7N4_9GAMM|nr:TolC family protein [Moraxella macacae]ELA08786.1 RND efflux system outer membrane lipoprotein [Moraxella macacae 0408225]